ncbi:hypothetical protein LOZ66_003085 [Ophidiomyces ophidiicola]|nr:hypothetical protein LOZ66_003085 [Ophidiomyces ophidiicola]
MASDFHHGDSQNLAETVSPSSVASMEQAALQLAMDEAADHGPSAAALVLSNDGDAEMRGVEQAQAHEGADKDDNAPSWSELKTKAGKERKRLPLACIVCRRKKIRCSGEKPACKHCSRSRIPCVYKVTTRKAAPRTDYMAMLDKRLKRMEERVIKIIPKDATRDMAGIGRAAVKPSAAGHTPRAPKGPNKKRSADEAFKAEMDEWLRDNSASASRDSLVGSWQPHVGDENKLLTEGAEFLPSMDIQEHLAEVFFDCIYGQSYLLLHKPSFMRRLKTGAVPPVLILAVCAISARFSSHPRISTEPAFLRGENWANAAATIALSRHDQPNITILTVFLILGLHEFGVCHGGRSWSFGGQALRMAYALQLHRELDRDPLGSKQGHSELSFTDREIRRRTMWACLLMDRYNSSGSQRPPIGNEKYLQIQLPIKESYFQMEIPGSTEKLDGSVSNPVSEGIGQLSDAKANMGVSAYIIRGVMLWGHIVDYLNLGGKIQDPYPLWSSESGYAKLKKELQEFSAALPSSLVFTPENLKNHDAEKVANQFLFLHLVIHQNFLFLNRFAIPFSPGGRSPKDIPKPFLNDAGRAAVEAAGHISMLISQASGYMLTVPFAGYCAYAASTVHIWGIFSKNVQFERTSKENLRHTYRYLNRMKQYWGMFHYMVESTKDRYRHFADAVSKGPASFANSEDSSMFQYGDWFDKYPQGVSRQHWEGPSPRLKSEQGSDAVMAQQSDLQSVEEFFLSLSNPSHTDKPRKQAKRRSTNAVEKNRRNTIATEPIMHTFETTAVQSHAQPSQVQPETPMIDTSPHQILPTNSNNYSNFPSAAIFSPTGASQFNPSTYKYSPNTDLPNLDRQLVYGAYSGFNSSSTGHFNSVPANNNNYNHTTSTNTGISHTDANDNPFWSMQMDLTGDGSGWPGGSLQPGAWFLPFNLDPIGMGDFDMSAGATPQTGAVSGAISTGNSYFEGPGMLEGSHLNTSSEGVGREGAVPHPRH